MSDMHAMLRTVANFTADCFRAVVVLGALAMVVITTAAPVMMAVGLLTVALDALVMTLVATTVMLAALLVVTVGLRLVAMLAENYLN